MQFSTLLCMKKQYMFLTLWIPGPKSPKSKLDVYLWPLIEELKQLWEVVVQTYDVSKKQSFTLKAAVLWTINDFPAYDMFSGWMTSEKLACPYCMKNTKVFRLKHEKKHTWFDFHRQFLPEDHSFRSNKSAFLKNRVEQSPPPPRLKGDRVWDHIHTIPNSVDYHGVIDG